MSASHDNPATIRAGLAAAAFAVGCLAGGAASAQPAAYPVRSFELTGTAPQEVVRLAAPHRIAVCLPGHLRTSAATLNGGEEPAIVPVAVAWRGRFETVRPGACLRLEASTVTLRAAHDLPSGFTLKGRLRVFGRAG